MANENITPKTDPQTKPASGNPAPVQPMSDPKRVDEQKTAAAQPQSDAARK
jgi:hypothetical protein